MQEQFSALAFYEELKSRRPSDDVIKNKLYYVFISLIETEGYSVKSALKRAIACVSDEYQLDKAHVETLAQEMYNAL